MSTQCGNQLQCMLICLNAKFICKEYTAIAVNLTDHIGNHSRVLGSYIISMDESKNSEAYDQDVIIEDDVWVG